MHFLWLIISVHSVLVLVRDLVMYCVFLSPPQVVVVLVAFVVLYLTPCSLSLSSTLTFNGSSSVVGIILVCC